jgi:hypothetical protein
MINDRLLISAQGLYAETLNFIDEISNHLPYLYVDYENNPDLNHLSNSLTELQQEFESGLTNPEILYRRLVNLHQRAHDLRDQYVREGEHQLHFNAQTVEQNFDWMYEQMIVMEDKIEDIPTLQTRYQKLFQKVDSFYPMDHSMRNVEYSKRLRSLVEEFVKLSYGSIQRQREKCGLCNHSLENQSFYKFIPCEHLFHVNCIGHWTNYIAQSQSIPEEPKCPICDTIIDTRLVYQ